MTNPTYFKLRATVLDQEGDFLGTIKAEKCAIVAGENFGHNIQMLPDETGHTYTLSGAHLDKEMIELMSKLIALPWNNDVREKMMTLLGLPHGLNRTEYEIKKRLEKLL